MSQHYDSCLVTFNGQQVQLRELAKTEVETMTDLYGLLNVVQTIYTEHARGLSTLLQGYEEALPGLPARSEPERNVLVTMLNITNLACNLNLSNVEFMQEAYRFRVPKGKDRLPPKEQAIKLVAMAEAMFAPIDDALTQFSQLGVLQKGPPEIRLSTVH